MKNDIDGSGLVFEERPSRIGQKLTVYIAIVGGVDCRRCQHERFLLAARV